MTVYGHWYGAYPGNELWVELRTQLGYCFTARFLGEWRPHPFMGYKFYWDSQCWRPDEVQDRLAFAGPACNWDCEEGVEGNMWIDAWYECP